MPSHMTTLPTKSFAWPLSREQRAFTQILVATDFSGNSMVALEWAIELAKTHNAQVTVVHSVPAGHPYDAIPESALADNIATKLAATIKLSKHWGLESQGEASPGKPWEVIPELARTMHADLIVVGARGESKISTRLLGSTADRIIRSSSTPVLVVHKGSDCLPQSIRTVVAAIDFSDESAIALQMAVQVARDLSQPVRVVMLNVPIIDGPIPGPRHTLRLPDSWKEIEGQNAECLEVWASALRDESVHIEVKTLIGYPPTVILEEVARTRAEVIALGTTGRTGLKRFFMGSVAEDVLRRARCTVLTARKPD